jgi:flagellar biosynthesis protein FliP
MDLLIVLTAFIGLVLCIALLRKEMITGKPSSSVFSLSVVIVFLSCLIWAGAAADELQRLVSGLLDREEVVPILDFE